MMTIIIELFSFLFWTRSVYGGTSLESCKISTHNTNDMHEDYYCWVYVSHSHTQKLIAAQKLSKKFDHSKISVNFNPSRLSIPTSHGFAMSKLPTSMISNHILTPTNTSQIPKMLRVHSDNSTTGTPIDTLTIDTIELQQCTKSTDEIAVTGNTQRESRTLIDEGTGYITNADEKDGEHITIDNYYKNHLKMYSNNNKIQLTSEIVDIQFADDETTAIATRTGEIKSIKLHENDEYNNNELIAATIIASIAHTNGPQFDNNNENINGFSGASFALYSAPIGGQKWNENIEFSGASFALYSAPIGGKKLNENIGFSSASFALYSAPIGGKKLNENIEFSGTLWGSNASLIGAKNGNEKLEFAGPNPSLISVKNLDENVRFGEAYGYGSLGYNYGGISRGYDSLGSGYATGGGEGHEHDSVIATAEDVILDDFRWELKVLFQWCTWCSLRGEDRDGHGLFIIVSPGGI